MDLKKEAFLKTEFIPLMQQLNPETTPAWGRMNAQQMVEHMSQSFRNANGKLVQPVITPADKLELFRAFMMSDKEFRENTKNAGLPEIPLPVQKPSMQAAIAELRQETEDFFHVFAENPELKIINPVFGELNYSEWIQLLHKHSMHHLKQFRLL